MRNKWRMVPTSSPFRHIREHVFGEKTAAAFAEALSISAGHLSRLESGAGVPSYDLMERVRALAAARGVPWNDALFFAVPQPQASAADAQPLPCAPAAVACERRPVSQPVACEASQ